MRAPYILYRRGGAVYYAAFWDMDMRRYVSWRSTDSLRSILGRRAAHLSPTSRAGAAAIAEMWMESGISGGNNQQFGEYLIDFWSTDSTYAQRRASRGRGLSLKYITNSRSVIQKHMIPYLSRSGKSRILLRQVTPGLLEHMVSDLARTLSPSGVNAVLQTVSVAIREAYRLGEIPSNPTITVERLSEPRVVREILTPDEVRAFFAREWGDRRMFGINLLAATTGMRLGECRGVLIEDIHADWIDVRHNWQDGEGIKKPKGGRCRAVPLPSGTAQVLQELIEDNPWKNDFVFYGSSRDRPLGRTMIGNSFRSALLDIRISHAERTRRRLTFHGWRHWYNSMLRGRVDDHVLQRLTGHRSDEMTERYTEITTEQRKAVGKLAEKLI